MGDFGGSGARQERASDATLRRVAELDAERARIEAELASAMVEHADQVRREAESELEDPRVQDLQSSAASDEMAVVLRQPTRTVQERVSATRFARGRLPRTWAAHRAGRIDAFTVRVIVEHARKLTHPYTVVLLDERGVEYAARHTVSQIRAWLRLFLAREEPDASQQRHRRSHDDRSVYAEHHPDGISWLHAQLTTTDAFRIDRMATRLAEKRSDNEPGLTLEQARADVIADILLGRVDLDDAVTGRSHAGATIGVMVPVTSLAGVTDDPGESFCGEFALDPQLVRELAAEPDTVFFRILHDPLGRILDVTEVGRFPSRRLRTAIELRDGTCIFPTCSRPAEACDVDHEIAHPRGPTTGHNLRLLCRRHHRMKSHGVVPRMDREHAAAA